MDVCLNLSVDKDQDHCCASCGKDIKAGDKHIQDMAEVKGIHNSTLQMKYYHPNCFTKRAKMFRLYD